jgi:hypothetical protein
MGTTLRLAGHLTEKAKQMETTLRLANETLKKINRSFLLLLDTTLNPKPSHKGTSI